MKREVRPGKKKFRPASSEPTGNHQEEDIRIKVLGIRVEAKKVTTKSIILVVIVMLLAIALVLILGTPMHYVFKRGIG